MRIKKIFNASRGLLISATLLLGLAVAGIAFGASPKVSAAQECGPNAIIYCGFTTNDQFINYMKAGKDNYPGGAHTDLQAIMNHFGLTADKYERFRTTAVDATVYKDGRVVLSSGAGGQTVMTAANSIGRTTLNGRHDKSINIGGKTYYYGLTSRVFLSNSIPAKVMLDKKGNAEFVILTDCANPVWGDKINSDVKCDALNASAVSGKPKDYNFTAKGTAVGNAKITKYVYDFGDGTPQVTQSNGSTVVPHTFKPGTYTVKVTVYATVPGGQTITSTCIKTITVAEDPKPFYQCLQLKATPVDVRKYDFSVTSRYGNGAVLESASFDFGDRSTPVVVKAGDKATSVATSYEYLTGGRFTAKATLTYVVAGKKVTATSTTCQTVVNPEMPYYECVELRSGDPVGLKYVFTATARYGNGAKLINADFDFGDGVKQAGVVPTTPTAFVVEHTYATAGQYSAAAILTFSLPDGRTVKALTCTAMVKPNAPAVPECKPGVPVGDPSCDVCQYDATLAPNDPKCVAPPQVLPNTGAGNIVALASAALIGGFLYYRNKMFKEHQREAFQAQTGTSPLPLADPLSPDNPLVSTPHQPQQGHRSTLRRRRQF